MRGEALRAPLSKNRFFERNARGEFGNTVRVWPTRAELDASGYRGQVAVRYCAPSAPYCRYNVPYEGIDAVIAEFCAAGAKAEYFLFNEGCPDAKLLMQGEMVRCPTLRLWYSTRKEPMRVAIASEPKWADGLTAKLIVDTLCWPKSAAMLWDLLDKYPDAAVEFGVYGVTLGCLPGHNTVIWEVREY